MSAAAATRARRLLAAYPWRVRAERGDEIVATVLDALPPGAERLGWRDQLDLVRGGVRTRWQRRPPPVDVVRYRLGGTLGPQWRAWVRDDVEDPHYRRSERMRWVSFAVAAAVLAAGLAEVVPVLDLIGGWALPFVLLLGSAGDERRQAAVRRRHGLEPLAAPPGGPVVLGPRRRAVLPNVRIAPVVAGLGAALLPAGLAALAVVGSRGGRGTGPWEIVGPGDEGFSVVITGPDLVPLFVGGMAGMAVVLGLVELASQPRRGQPVAGATVPAAARSSVGATALALGLLLGLAGGLPVGATGPVAAVAGALVPLGALLLVGAAAVAVFEHRRRAPIGLWDLFPRLWLHPVVDRP